MKSLYKTKKTRWRAAIALGFGLLCLSCGFAKNIIDNYAHCKENVGKHVEGDLSDKWTPCTIQHYKPNKGKRWSKHGYCIGLGRAVHHEHHAFTYDRYVMCIDVQKEFISNLEFCNKNNDFCCLNDKLEIADPNKFWPEITYAVLLYLKDDATNCLTSPR